MPRKQPETVYRDGSKLVRPTGESPRQFAGMIFAVYEGDSPETVVEHVRTLDQLQGLPEVDANQLSPSWRKALRLSPIEQTVSVAESKPATNRQPGGSCPQPVDDSSTWRVELAEELRNVWKDPILATLMLPISLLITLFFLGNALIFWVEEWIDSRGSKSA